MRVSLISIVPLFCLCLSSALSQVTPPASTNGTTAIKAERSASKSVLQITIETSRSQPTAGSGLGVNALITNVSTTAVALTNWGTTLVIPPEITAGDYFDFVGVIPGSMVLGPPPTNQQGDNAPPVAGLLLGAGESCRAFWFLERVGPGAQRLFFLSRAYSQFESEMRFLFFTPGDYRVAVQVRHWPDIASAANAALWTSISRPPERMNTTTASTLGGVSVETASMRVATPQFVILVGAAFGGLFAFLLRSRITTVEQRISTRDARMLVKTSISRLGRALSPAVGFILLSVIITILLNRISESQLLIRVSIVDLWGAIAVGFVAALTGGHYLGRLLGETSASQTVLTRRQTPERVHEADRELSRASRHTHSDGRDPVQIHEARLNTISERSGAATEGQPEDSNASCTSTHTVANDEQLHDRQIWGQQGGAVKDNDEAQHMYADSTNSSRIK